MDEMEELFDKPILEQLFQFRKEYFEQRIYDNNKELKELEQNVLSASEKVSEFVKKEIDDDKKFAKFEKLNREVDLLNLKEIEFWMKQYYKLGLTDFLKIKEELFTEKYPKYQENEEIQNNINTLMDDSFDDIMEMLEEEKKKYLVNTKKYKNMHEEYNNIAKKYPKSVLAFEDFESNSLSKEEVTGLVELIKQDKDKSFDEIKLAFKLGLKFGANL